jgi:hypothetical protein
MKKSELKQLIKEEMDKVLELDSNKQYHSFKEDIDKIWYKMNSKYITEEKARLLILDLYSKYFT